MSMGFEPLIIPAITAGVGIAIGLLRGRSKYQNTKKLVIDLADAIKDDKVTQEEAVVLANDALAVIGEFRPQDTGQ